jgi:nitroreductase / dihydropteridine reductase
MNVSEIAQSRYTTKSFDPGRKLTSDTVNSLCDVLRNAPSSVNSQPWHFIVASSDDAKRSIVRGMQGAYVYNAAKVMNASHVIVFCARDRLDDVHLNQVLAQETLDGRFATPDAQANQNKLRLNFVELHRNQLSDERQWIEKQIYLSLGSILFAAGAMGVDTCTMEGFDGRAVDQALGLEQKGMHSVVILALGFRSGDDFNARLPKSRLPASLLLTEV